jgi:hypothetical protein
MRWNAIIRPIAWVAIPCSILMLASCSDKTTASKADAGATNGGVTASSGVAALGKATFSAVVDGERVSGGVIDEMQQQNAAYTVPSNGSRPAYLLFYLFDTQAPNDPHFSHSFRVYLPKQVGTATDADLTLNVILDADHSARYNSSTPSITITSLTATRVSGTFSAKMKASPDSSNASKQEVEVTEGRFDIPMATSKIIPP